MQNMSTDSVNKHRLREVELKILKREEEAIHLLLSKYRKALNALKVEELTIMSDLGATQDRERLSRNEGSRSASVTSERSLTMDEFDVNGQAMNLATAPSISRMLNAQNKYQMADDSDVEEVDSE